MTHGKNAYFSKFRAPSFLHCFFFYHLRHGRQKNNEARGPFSRFFLDFLAHFDVEGPRNFWFGDASQNKRVLPRVVCLCGAVGVSVESVIESVML